MSDSENKSSRAEEWMARQSSSDIALDVSVVIPAYNEQWRLPTTLIDMIDYFEQHPQSYEILVVDDGSRDDTVGVVRKFERIRSTIKLIRVPTNHGKGFAVRTGVLNAKGRRVLFADADGATPIQELARLNAALDAGADIAIGSRAKRSEETKVVTQWYKKLRGRVFNLLMNTLVVSGIEDSQCGFKLFTAPAARFIFERQREPRFSFDVEVLYIARVSGMRIAEVPVNWTNVPGSKVHPILDPLRMLRDLFYFRWMHRKLEKNSFPRS